MSSRYLKETFIVYEGLLCHYSEYFRKGLRGGFQEASTKILYLSDVTPRIFRMFLGWIHFGELTSPTGNVENDPIWLYLPDLWIYGDKLIVPLLQNEVMDIMFDRAVTRKGTTVWDMHTAYEDTVPSSPLHRFYIDFVCRSNYRIVTQHKVYHDRWYVDSALDLVNAAYDKADEIQAWDPEDGGNTVGCRYHNHTSDGASHEAER